MHFDAFWGIVCLFAIALLFYGPWQAVCTYYARQVLFEKRDAIFDMAVVGDLDFKSQEYRTIRVSLEQTIRFAHELTLPRFLLFRWYLRRANLKQTRSELREAVISINDERTRKRIAGLVYEVQRALFLMMFARSPLTVLAWLLLTGFLHFGSGLGKQMERLIRPFGEMAQMEAEYAPVKGRVYENVGA